MERELEKDLKEIEYLIYVHKERENTHTQSVLERAHEIIETCAKAARTLPELEELLSRENDTEITRSSRDSQFGECSQREVYMKAYEDALNEDSVSEAFLADCKRVAQKYKKDNDDWIPVDRELPPNAKHEGAFCPKYQVMTNYGVTEGWYNPDAEGWYVLIWFMTDRYLESEIDFDKGDNPKIVFLPDEVNSKQNILTAWKEAEPYHSERSDNYDRE